jgi:CheY-like chemotaxis protein
MVDRVNILLVADEPVKLLNHEYALAELGENLIKAHSASEALEHLLRNDIAVVLLDVTIRGRKGFPLANLIRKHPRFQDVVRARRGPGYPLT